MSRRLLCVVLALGIGSCGPEPEPLPPNVAEVPGVATLPNKGGLAFDAATSGRVVHLAWRIGKQTVRYARSDDAGRTWEPSRDLGVTGTPRVVAHGDTVLVLSVGHGVIAHISADGGRSWTEGGAQLLRYSLTASALSRAPGGELILAAAAPLPYQPEVVEDGYRHPPSRGVAGRRMTTLSFRSADGGRSWSEPVPLGPFAALGDGGGGHALDASGESCRALRRVGGRRTARAAERRAGCAIHVLPKRRWGPVVDPADRRGRGRYDGVPIASARGRGAGGGVLRASSRGRVRHGPRPRPRSSAAARLNLCRRRLHRWGWTRAGRTG